VEEVFDFVADERNEPRYNPRMLSAEKTSDGPIGIGTFESVPAGTRMRWSWEVRPRGALLVMAPFVGAIGRRQEQGIWCSLKRLLESGAAGR
jgi:hypothetical protein